MVYKSKQLICLFVLVALISGYDCYYQYFDDQNENQNQTEIDPVSVKIIPINGKKKFPNEFILDVKCEELRKTLRFTIQDGIINDPSLKNVYLGNRNGHHKKDFTKKFEYKHYKDVTNGAIATLMPNDDLHQMELSKENPFRLIATIYMDGVQIDLIPAVESRKRSNKRHFYVMTKSQPQNNDKIKSIDAKRKRRSMKINKRSLNGQPLQLYVEYLVVIDSSVYIKYQTLLSQLNQDFLLQYLHVQYSHFVNAIDLRYELSLANDPDLSLNIRIANLLVYQNASDTPWTNSSAYACGDANYTTYNGREVLIAPCALSSFGSAMSSKTFPFNYDFAVSVVNKDLWSATVTDLPSIRSSYIGLSFKNGVCSNTLKYSVIEDLGFGSIYVAAHELGHGLGSDHDGQASTPGASCPQTDNYIMTPMFGAIKYNYSSLFYFSNCSIHQFKSLLVGSNGNVTRKGSCLLNLPMPQFNISSVANTSLPGTQWNPDDQCKIYYGSTATYRGCESATTSICETIYCNYGGLCRAIAGWGALEGTPCNSTGVCYRGSCVPTSSIVNGSITATNCYYYPCLNGATCIATFRFYTCKCAPNFTGYNCETRIA